MTREQIEKEFKEWMRRREVAEAAKKAEVAQFEVLEAAVAAHAGIEVGTVVKDKYGKLFSVAGWQVHFWPSSNNPLDGSIILKGYQQKKDGSYGTLTRNIYDWEKVEEGK